MIEPYPDWELDEHGPQTTERVHTVLPVHAHGLLGDALPVVLETFLELLELGLQARHGLHLAALLYGERHQSGPNDDREADDSETEAAEEYAVQQHEAVDHRADDDSAPDVADQFHGLETHPVFKAH